MHANQSEMDILRQAINAVVAEGVGVEFDHIRPEPGMGAGGRRFDAEVSIRCGGVKRLFVVEVKRCTLTPAALPMLEVLVAKVPSGASLLVVAEQIGPSMARALRKQGIAFLDTGGNAFLSGHGFHVWVSGKRSSGFKRVVTGLHRQNAVKVIFALLADPLLDQDPAAAYLNDSVRTLARAADVALGSVGGVLDSLRTMGFLLDDNGVRRLVERERLIELWATDYLARLRHRLVRQRYRVASVLNWEKWPVLPPHVLWGGEIAGARLTRHLRPEKATIYAPTLPDDWIVRAGLQTDPDGNVEVLAPFWGDDLSTRWASTPKGGVHDCVHPLIVYADLLAGSDDRRTETAKRIYDQFLRKLAASD